MQDTLDITGAGFLPRALPVRGAGSPSSGSAAMAEP